MFHIEKCFVTFICKNKGNLHFTIVSIRQNCIHFVTIEICRYLFKKQWWLLSAKCNYFACRTFKKLTDLIPSSDCLRPLLYHSLHTGVLICSVRVSQEPSHSSTQRTTNRFSWSKVHGFGARNDDRIHVVRFINNTTTATIFIWKRKNKSCHKNSNRYLRQLGLSRPLNFQKIPSVARTKVSRCQLRCLHVC